MKLNVIKIFLLVLFTAFNTIVFSQTDKQIYIPTYSNGDTSYWYKSEYKRDDKLKLKHLVSDTSNYYFRFRTDGQIIDIWSNNNKTYFGQLTNYTYTYIPYSTNKGKRKVKIHSNHVQLDTSDARQIYRLSKVISSIPTEDSILNWQQGDDGIIYTIETSSPNYYYFKTYWTPTYQDSTLKEAKQIQSFVDSTYLILNLNKEWESFFNTLKPGRYNSGGMSILYKFSKKQIRLMDKNRPYQKYFDDIHDTLTHFLNDTINKIIHVNGDSLTDYQDYYLNFNTKNKLKKIKIDKDQKNSEYFDKKEFLTSKKIIKKTFKHVKANFIHSKVRYWILITYQNDKIIFH